MKQTTQQLMESRATALLAFVASLAMVAAVIFGASPVGATSAFLQENTNRWGADYRVFTPSKASPHACAAACSGDKKCLAWTYVHPGAEGPEALCRLKDTVTHAQANPCCISGVTKQLETQATASSTLPYGRTTAPGARAPKGAMPTPPVLNQPAPAAPAPVAPAPVEPTPPAEGEPMRLSDLEKQAWFANPFQRVASLGGTPAPGPAPSPLMQTATGTVQIADQPIANAPPRAITPNW